MEDTKTKYIDTKKLIALLEQRKKQLVQWTDKEYANQRIDEIDCILDVDIDSLQQEQPIQVNTLTWKDIVDLERIINNVHYEFRYGIGQKSFGDEVLDRFRAERDEQEQPEVDLEKVYDAYCKVCGHYHHTTPTYICRHACDYFKDFEALLNARKEE